MAATKLDSRQDIYRGQLMLFADSNPLAFATTATMEVTTEEVDISNKMMGNWSGYLPGRKSYTISSEALITYKEGALSYATLLDKQINDQTLPFQFGEGKAADADNFGGTFELDTTKDNFSGEVMITSLSLTSEQGNIARVTTSLRGIGGLKHVVGVPSDPVEEEDGGQ